MKWSFFDPNTGSVVGFRYGGPLTDLAANTPSGLTPILGEVDGLSQRVDVVALAAAKEGARAEDFVVDYQPPRPSVNHEWDANRRRWTKSAPVVARELADRRARARIAALELAQHRPVRELTIDPNNAEAQSRLDEIDSEIATLRQDLIAARD